MGVHKSTNLIGLILFWGWNVLSVFLCVFLIGLAVLPYVFMAAINGEIPLSITICLLTLMLTPIYAIYFGIKQPKKAVAFFFGVEIPVVILTLFRIFIVRELTLASGFLLLSAFLAIGFFAWSLRGKESPREFNPYITTAMSTLVLITGLYVAVLSALYAFPLTLEFLKGFFSFNWMRDIGYGDGLVFLILALFFFGSLAFFVFPIFVGYFYPRLWKQNGQIIQTGFPVSKYRILSALFAATWLGTFMLVSHQGDANYVSRLKEMSVADKKIEMMRPNKVRKKLLSAYLNEYRYLGTQAESRNLIPIYKRSIGSEYIGEKAQSVQNFLLRPLLYKGGRSDGREAGKLYAELFDSSIQREETKSITKALEATFNRDEVVAGLMNIGVRNVLLREQNIDVQTKGSFATVEIEEVYENLTFENQEIFYYFSLPEDAAITGIWIGRTDKREEMDAFIIAPRGAAQKVYEQQVRRNIDPALLEQVGPAQYRLRVFPIPATRGRAQFGGNRNNRQLTQELQLMRVHMQYDVPLGTSEPILPTLLEKRNVGWSKKTTRQLNGKIVGKTKNWMPEFKAVSTSDSSISKVDIPMGSTLVTMTSTPGTVNSPVGKIAVILDTSYSMSDKRNELTQKVKDLAALQNTGLADIDYYIGSAGDESMLKTSVLNVDEIKPYGSLTSRNLFNQFLKIADANNYAAVILLTDQGLYGTEGSFNAAQFSAPLHFLHVDKAAAAYDDDILDHIYRSGGGVATSVQSLHQQLSLNGPNTRVVGNRVWKNLAVTTETKSSANLGMESLAARQFILMNSFGKAPNVKTLDELHTLAKEHDIVTPYSSMIVLVNERQKEALKAASESEDRFDREGRSGQESLSSPANPLVSGVPEPHEWLLIILSIVMLFVIWRRQEEWDTKLAN